MGPQVTGSGKTLGRTFGKMFALGAAITAAAGIGRFLKGSIEEAREAQKVGAQTEAVIKSMGLASTVTAERIADLASAMSLQTGVDDEVIQSSQNVLLTFANLAKTAGVVGGAFDRASSLALDMSVALKSDLKSASIQVGKALNDPVKGVTALGRAGVQFTEQQKAQIAAMVEVGNVAGAQKVILGELTKQFQGSAEAQATAGDKARVAWDNLKEQVGTALIPALDALASLFANKIAPAISGLVANLQSGEGSAGRFGSVIRNDVMPVITQWYTYMFTKVIPAIRDALVPAIAKGKVAFNQIRDSIRENKPELTQIFNALKKVGDFVLTKLIPAQIKLASVAIPILSAAIRILINAAVFWVHVFEGVKFAVEQVRSNILKTATAAKTAATRISAAFKYLPTLLKAIGVQIAVGLAKGLLAGAGAVTAAVNHLISLIPGPIRKIMGVSSPSKVTEEIGRQVAEGLVVGMKGSADKVGEAAENLAKKVKEKIGGLRDTIAGLKSDFASLVEPISSAFTSGLFDATTASEFVASLLGSKGQLSGLIDAFKTLIKQGLNPGFLYQLFQSGNAGLIMDLAANPALASQAGGLFSDVMNLSDQLGTSVAGATDKGAKLEAQTVRLEKKLDHLIAATKKVGKDVGDEVNGAASNGRRRAA